MASKDLKREIGDLLSPEDREELIEMAHRDAEAMNKSKKQCIKPPEMLRNTAKHSINTLVSA